MPSRSARNRPGITFASRRAQAPQFVPISSDQLPSGAFMSETGRVGGMSSEDAGRLGGYMDEQGRVFVPAGMGVPPAAPQLRPAVQAPAGTIQPAAIVQGLTPKGTVDRRQSDEYKSQLAQYRNLIAKGQQQEAEELGMKTWMQKYGDKGLGLTGPNPLMQDFGGFVPTQGPTPAVLQADESLKGVNTFFPGAGPEAFDPAAAQEMQQFATADQADMATTAGMSVGDRARALTRAYRLGQI